MAVCFLWPLAIPILVLQASFQGLCCAQGSSVLSLFSKRSFSKTSAPAILNFSWVFLCVYMGWTYLEVPILLLWERKTKATYLLHLYVKKWSECQEARTLLGHLKMLRHESSTNNLRVCAFPNGIYISEKFYLTFGAASRIISMWLQRKKSLQQQPF